MNESREARTGPLLLPVSGVANKRPGEIQTIPTRRKILLLLLILFLGLSQCSSPERSLPVTNLSKDLEPIRTEFNKDAGKVRLLLLVDPT